VESSDGREEEFLSEKIAELKCGEFTENSIKFDMRKMWRYQ